jgi:signal peptidase I
MTSTAVLDNQPVRGRRWPGVLLSLFVPGFGLVRAGRPLRGLAWFIGLQFLGVVLTVLFIVRAVPTWVVCGGMLAGFVCVLTMLVDSFRPGRMTWPLALGFVIVFVALVALPPVHHLMERGFKVPTAAMEPTLIGASHGTPDYVIVDRVSYLFSQPKRGDLVAFRATGIMGIEADDEILFVKRLVGLPGEKIEIRDGHIFADGRLLDDGAGIPPITYISATQSVPSVIPEGGSYTVPQDGFFFVGDNSAHSLDSRHWGSVPRKNIFGRVSRIYYPLSRIGVPR